MSLFKAREWWSAKSGFEELHDLGLLAVGNIDNTPAGFGKDKYSQQLYLHLKSYS